MLASAAPTAPAVYVLFGRPDGIGPSYQAQVTPSVPPLALAVGDVDGDGQGDLVTLGATDDNVERIEAFPALDRVNFAAPWRAETTELSTLARGKAMLEVLDFEADGVADLAFADELHAATARGRAATEVGFGDMAIAALPSAASFGPPSSAFIVPGAGGRDLVVVSAWFASLYAQLGASPPTLTHATATTGWGTHATCDLDGDGRLEVLGGAGTWIAIKPGLTDDTYTFDNDLYFGLEGTLAAAACGQLDRDAGARLDLAVLQQPPATAGVVVNVLPDLQLIPSPPSLHTSRAAVITLPLPTTDAVVMVGGDFDGDHDRELLVVATDGTITCLTLGADALAPCAP